MEPLTTTVTTSGKPRARRLHGALALTLRTMPQLLSDDIRRQIIEGSLNPGDALPSEKELMHQYGVSRPTLREAMRVLAAESLIETRRGGNGGARVREPDPDVVIRQVGVLLQLSGATIGDVDLMRCIVEPPAVRLIALNRDVAAIDALERIADEAHAVRDDPHQWALVAGRFHRELVEMSGNVTLALIGRMLSSLTLAAYAVSMSLISGEDGGIAIKRALRSWTKLLTLMRQGDAAEAEAHWNKHMAASTLTHMDASTPIRVAVSESMPRPYRVTRV